MADNKEDDEAVYKVIEDASGVAFVTIISRLRWHPHDDMRRLDKSLGRLKRAKRIKFVNKKVGWRVCPAV